MATTSASYTLEQRPEPTARPKLLSNGVLGMLIFIFTEVMFFAGLVSAHTIVRSQAAGQLWPPYGQPRLPVPETAVNTAALLVSGIVLVLAWFAFRKDAVNARIPLLLSIMLGTFFVGFQGVEWVALLGEGLTMTSSTYGSFFYLIVGTHALHAVAALGGLGWAWLRLDRGLLTTSQLATVSAFWYFVVLVWPVLYLKVYL
jgi:heme/copper-type cytochrome/quinol oxidase subunit 3